MTTTKSKRKRVPLLSCGLPLPSDFILACLRATMEDRPLRPKMGKYAINFTPLMLLLNVREKTYASVRFSAIVEVKRSDSVVYFEGSVNGGPKGWSGGQATVRWHDSTFNYEYEFSTHLGKVIAGRR